MTVGFVPQPTAIYGLALQANGGGMSFLVGSCPDFDRLLPLFGCKPTLMSNQVCEVPSRSSAVNQRTNLTIC